MVLKIIFQKIALTSPSVPIHEVVGPIMLALNVTADSRVTGSIGAAFANQFKKCLTAILREAKSTLVSIILDTMLMVHPTIPPRVERVHEIIYEQRKAQHIIDFQRLLAPPPGFSLDDYPHMHSFHAQCVVVGGVTVARPSRVEPRPSPLATPPSNSREPMCVPLELLLGGGIQVPPLPRGC